MSTGISGLYKNTKGAKTPRKTHDIKILPEYFDAIENGTKTFEIRYNDRDYKVGDLLCLREYRDGAYTGRKTVREICYMIDDPAYCKDGYVVLGLKQNHPEWISVDERLPDKEGTYLTYTDKNKMVFDVFCIYPSHNTKFWVGGNSKVTHWMPLPEAPKMKGDSDDL